jgi:hypothetical protein
MGFAILPAQPPENFVFCGAPALMPATERPLWPYFKVKAWSMYFFTTKLL